MNWILNLPDEECCYEDSKKVRKEWEELASPEIGYLQNNFYFFPRYHILTNSLDFLLSNKTLSLSLNSFTFN